MNKFWLKLIELYQINPFRKGNSCRFTPTCSEYMKDAIIMHGSVKGIWLGIKRILRCRPFGKYGYDPVKENL